MSAPTIEARRLYRDFWRLYRRWPAEEMRSKSFREYWMSRVRKGFEEGGALKDPTGAEALIAEARVELDNLTAILDGKVEKEFPLASDGPIMSHLPSAERFKLLDVGMNETIRKQKNQFGFLVQDFKSKFKK